MVVYTWGGLEQNKLRRSPLRYDENIAVEKGDCQNRDDKIRDTVMAKRFSWPASFLSLSRSSSLSLSFMFSLSLSLFLFYLLSPTLFLSPLKNRQTKNLLGKKKQGCRVREQ